ncbi:hypothetical protein D6745_04520 [Candidatus Woesearchaeota archaeon]|nr:MAG: hypothetical protein D6745_04520 [Candidatus Woesearchaeota archaeon]
MLKHVFPIFFVLLIILLVSCTTSTSCDSGMYTGDGKCCNYVCDIDCEHGYKEGSCNCECLSINSNGQNDSGQDQDLGIDDVFGNNTNIQPPPIIPQ